jgi:hypothetical protein
MCNICGKPAINTVAMEKECVIPVFIVFIVAFIIAFIIAFLLFAWRKSQIVKFVHHFWKS